MRAIFIHIIQLLKGIFLPKQYSSDTIEELKNWEYKGPDKDKENMKSDIQAIKNDFQQAITEAKIKFECNG